MGKRSSARDLVHRLGAKAFSTHLAGKKKGYEGSGVVCLHCQQAPLFHGYRASCESAGVRGVPDAAYYYCGRCGTGVLPWDEQVGLTARSFTPAAERLVSWQGPWRQF